MRKNLSQQKLLDVLTEETEILRKTSQNIKEVAPEIARQLHNLKTNAIDIIIIVLKRRHSHYKEKG